MKSQFVGMLIHAVFLGLILAGGFGVEMAENLFSGVMVLWCLFWWFCFYTLDDDAFWVRKAPGSKPILRRLIQSLIGFQVVFVFAFGWFWVGGLYLFTTLLIYGRQLTAKRKLAEV